MKKLSTKWSIVGEPYEQKEVENVNKKTTFKKWAAYIALVLVCTAIGGDFGLIASIALIFMLQ